MQNARASNGPARIAGEASAFMQQRHAPDTFRDHVWEDPDHRAPPNYTGIAPLFHQHVNDPSVGGYRDREQPMSMMHAPFGTLWPTSYGAGLGAGALPFVPQPQRASAPIDTRQFSRVMQPSPAVQSAFVRMPPPAIQQSYASAEPVSVLYRGEEAQVRGFQQALKPAREEEAHANIREGKKRTSEASHLSDAHEEQQLSFSVSPQADEEELRREWQAFQVQAKKAQMSSAELVQQRQKFKQHLKNLDIKYHRPADTGDRRQESARWNLFLNGVRYKEMPPDQRSELSAKRNASVKEKKTKMQTFLQEAGGPARGEAGALSFSVATDVTETQARAAWEAFIVQADAAQMPCDQLMQNREKYLAVLYLLRNPKNKQRSSEEKEALYQEGKVWRNVISKAKYRKMTPEERYDKNSNTHAQFKLYLNSLPPEFKEEYSKRRMQGKSQQSSVADASVADASDEEEEVLMEGT